MGASSPQWVRVSGGVSQAGLVEIAHTLPGSQGPGCTDPRSFCPEAGDGGEEPPFLLS